MFYTAVPEQERPAPTVETAILLVGLDGLSEPFRAALEGKGVRTRVVHRHSDAVAAVQEMSPQLTVVGTALQSDPLLLLRDITLIHPEGRTLFLVPREDPELAADAISEGADDVVAPPHSFSSVFFRARILEKRPRHIHKPELGERTEGALTVGRISRTVGIGDDAERLTGREFEVLECLLRARGRVVRREEILESIWGEHQESDAVLDATVHRLRKKLEADPANPRVLTTVRGIGYRLEAGGVRLANA